MSTGEGTIKIKSAGEYSQDLLEVSRTLDTIFDEMKKIIMNLQSTEGWSGDSASIYYETFNRISQTFPGFVKDIENFGNHVGGSAQLYDSLNRKYDSQ